jgi:hypothetical protein
MASAMTEVMTMSQIGQPAASMMDSTADFPLRQMRRHFSPPSPVPQGLVRVSATCHKTVGEQLEALDNPFQLRRIPQKRCSDGRFRVALPRIACRICGSVGFQRHGCLESSTEPVDKPVDGVSAPTPSNATERLFFLPLNF